MGQFITIILTILGIWTIMMMAVLALVITMDIWDHFFAYRWKWLIARFKRQQ